MKKHKYIFYVSFFLFLTGAGCGYLATSEDVGSVQSQLDTLSKQNAETAKKVSAFESNQTTYQTNLQASLMDVSDKTENEIKDVKNAFNESQNELKTEIGDMAKKQDESNLSYKSDLDTFKKSYNDTLSTLNSFNSSFITYQNDLMTLKQNMDTLNSKQDSLTKENANLNTQLNNKINILLNEIVQQESEIFILREKITDLSGAEPQSGKKGKSTLSAEVKNKIYVAKKGDTVLTISRKFNVSADKLKKANKLKTNKVNSGQRIIIP